jgi:hypothetical protein
MLLNKMTKRDCHRSHPYSLRRVSNDTASITADVSIQLSGEEWTVLRNLPNVKGKKKPNAQRPTPDHQDVNPKEKKTPQRLTTKISTQRKKTP